MGVVLYFAQDVFIPAVVILLGVWFGYAFWGIPGVMLATPVLVALKVAAQSQPDWRVLRDFLSPNAYWHPKSLRRLRVADQPAAAPEAPPEPAPKRRSA